MSTQSNYQLQEIDYKWVQRAFFIKALQYPQRIKQSNFNVLCIITYSIQQQSRDTVYPLPVQRYGPSIQHGVEYIVGVNVETCFIGNGLCAERSALVQLAQIQYHKIHAIYLVSDSINNILTPGMLCREFLSEYIDGTTPIIMASVDTESTQVLQNTTSTTASGIETQSVPDLLYQKLIIRATNIDLLFPYKCLYLGINRPDILTYLQKFQQQAEQVTTQHIPSIQALKQQFSAVLNQSQRDNIHPVRFAAGIFDMKSQELHTPLPHTIYTQHKLLEYNYTLDPVCMLLNDLHTTFTDKSTLNQYALLIVDQYHNLYAPVAAARAHLYEYGYKKLNVLLHDRQSKQLVLTTVEQLVPDSVRLDEILGNK